MADVSHLERMGRELKCPICLSLLDSAATINCNHVFCKLCIEKSMKTAMSCPVCKVPFRRRELRPVPHMDNLVCVYKSMETASEVTIFGTQNEASNKLSAEMNENKKVTVSLDDICEMNGSENTTKHKRRSSLTELSNPSFPTKKRVQVSQFQDYGARNEPEKTSIGTGENVENGLKKCSIRQPEVPAVIEKRGRKFSPFFWLRDDDDLEKSSQEIEDDEMTCTPPNVPCFSDIKDSDDEVSFKESPKNGTCADFIDSEMFDWTQRPCSPELCSSPLAMQIADIAEEHVAPDSAELTLTEANKGQMVLSSNGEGVSKKRVRKASVSKDSSRTSSKKTNGSSSTDAIRQKRIKRSSMAEVSAGHEKSEENIDKSLSSKKTRKNKKIGHKASAQVTLGKRSITPLSVENVNKTLSDSLASEYTHKSPDKSINFKKRGNTSKSTEKRSPKLRKCGNKGKTRKSNLVKDHANKDEVNQALISPLNLNLSPPESRTEVLGRGRRSTIEKKGMKTSNSINTVKISVEGMAKDGCDRIPFSNDGGTVVVRKLPNSQCATKVLAKTDEETSAPKGRVLQKSKKFPSTVSCSFCQSSEDSEASGAMVHYLNGKPISADNNEKSKSIHVHKNCAEWAPNVYFDGDKIVNLDAELSRSRRIKCSCCGIKGAALGCYEKSCHRSFHVPCAKKTPECRWDHENFVMVCPLHVSCQLPNEMSEAQSTHTRKSALPRKSCTVQVKANNECRGLSNLPLKSRKMFKNLVLCCSGLSTEEKEIVNEFEKLYGVAMLTQWCSSVTHVITSVDENGACKRTLKFLMGVLEGKWILNVQWIKACMDAGQLVNEQQYEISMDVHGIKNGPKLGRSRVQKKEPKLFEGYKFFFTSDFPTSYKGYLHDLVIAAGGKVLNRKPIAEDGTTTLIIYNQELPDHCKASDKKGSTSNQRCIDAEALAKSAGASLASNTWILNSIAGHKLQNL